MAQEPARRNEGLYRLLLAAVLALTFLAFRGALDGAFLDWDDRQLVWENRTVLTFDWGGIATEFAQSIYHPLTLLTYAVEHALFGLDPWWFHLTNLVLHGASVVLVASLVRTLWPGEGWLALGCAALFALHPLHVESVAWIGERKDVLCGALFLGSLTVYARGAGARHVAFALFLLALLAKPMAVTLPVLAVAIDVLRAGRWDRRFLTGKAHWFAASVVLGLWNLVGQSTARIVETEPWRLAEALGNAGRSLVFYLSKTLWPEGLVAYYDERLLGLESGDWLRAACVVGVLVLGCLRGGRRGLVRFGCLWFLVTIALVLKLVPFGERSLVNDRYMYLPSVGLFLALLCAAMEGLRQGMRGRSAGLAQPAVTLVSVLGATLVGHLTVRTAEQCRTWADDEALWRNVLARYPQTVKAHEELAIHLTDEGRMEEAREHLEIAVALEPENARLQLNLGTLLGRMGDHARALACFERVVAAAPEDALAHANLGMALFLLGRASEARGALERALALDPAVAHAHLFLARLKRAAGEMGPALSHLEAVTELAPWMPEGWAERAALLEALGRAEEAAAVRARVGGEPSR